MKDLTIVETPAWRVKDKSIKNNYNNVLMDKQGKTYKLWHQNNKCGEEGGVKM